MPLDYVRKGESVRASTVNSIIDAIGGNQRMSPDLNVTTTARGPQVSMPSVYGGPNQKPDQLLDVGRYMLSGWPMVKLQLGFTVDDCLGAMKYHRADGTTSTPVSAAVVFSNSDECPTGSSLSGYALAPSDFGLDAAAYAAGWVDTMIEDPYPGGVLKAQLWKYKSGAELAEVFTNVDDQLSVRQQLSSVLWANGASEEDLSTLNIVGSWSLVQSSNLSVEGQENLVPTHETVCRHGTIDCYEAGSFDYNVVLKASLECIDVQKDGSGEVQSTTWAWKIPLGPDAYCSGGKARSSSVTYGGNEVVFEVEEGEIGPGFGGDATYNGRAIWYGSYEVEAGGEVGADEVWLSLSYDYQVKATKGEFSSSKSSGSYTQDGILSRNVFVVKVSSFKPGADVAKGDKAPAESLEHGTWGILPKDGPKLDTYCKKDSTTEFKSLDWADREGEDVECQCAELHEFDQLETVDSLSTDHLVIRRPDVNGGAELKYISLSSLEISGMYVPPDADVPAAETSSLQTRELENGSSVEELFQFHVPDTVDVRVSDLSGVDIVMRNPNNGRPYLEYGRLRVDVAPSAVVSGDTEVVGARKSIDLVDEPGSDPYYQLHDFQAGVENGPDTYLRFEDQPTLTGADFSIGCQTQFVVRVPDGNNGYEIRYRQLSAYQEHERVDGGALNTRGRSVDFTPYDEGYGCYKVLQLYGFDWGCSNFITSADISGSSGNGILIRKWDDLGCCWQLDYMNFDSLDELAVKYVGDSQLSLSSHNPYNRSTTVWEDEYDGKRYVELYGFKSDFENNSVTIRGDGCTYYWPQDVRTDQILTEQDYILVKHVDGYGNISLKYTQLEVQMPDIDGIESDITSIYSQINSVNSDIQHLSGSIDELSGHLSGEYWERGGDSTTCYGSDIGDSYQVKVIDLDNYTLVGYWNCDQGLSVADSVIVDNGVTTGCSNYGPNYAYVDGAVRAGCSFEVGNSYLQESSLLVGCEITIGSTTINEAQLNALLQLI